MKKILMFGIPIVLAAGLLGAGAYGYHSHRQGMAKDFLEYRLDKLSKELNLTAAQQAQLDQIKQSMESRMDSGMQKRSEIHKMIKDELAKDNPNFSNIRPLLDQRIDDMAKAGHDVVAQVDSFYSQLTPDQKKKLSDHILERMSSHDHAFGD